MSLLPYHEARLASALECNADLNRQFFAKSLEASRLREALVEARGYLDRFGQEGVRDRIDKILAETQP